MSYNSMKATKTTRTTKSNWNISKSTTNKAKRAAKKVNANWFIVLLILIVGLVGGFFAHNYLFKNDIYEMVSANGETDIVLELGDNETQKNYTELGVKCIAFGKDYSKECSIKYYYRKDLSESITEVLVTDINTSNPGMFYAVYSCPSPKYASVTLIRNITVIGGEDNG